MGKQSLPMAPGVRVAGPKQRVAAIVGRVPHIGALRRPQVAYAPFSRPPRRAARPATHAGPPFALPVPPSVIPFFTLGKNAQH